MPEVWIEAWVGKSKLNLLLNSGARDLELVFPSRLTVKLGIKLGRKTKVLFGGREFLAGVGKTRLKVKDSKLGEERVGELEVVSLPDEVLDQPLLGVLGQEKFRVTPDTVTGEAVFK
jgi:hypothetical protein